MTTNKLTINEIRKLIWEYCDESEKTENGFYTNYVKEKMYNEHNIELTSIDTGGFDSPGYTIQCYAFGFIYEEKVVLVDHQVVYQ